MSIEMEMAEGEDKLLGGMLEVIRFTEGVSAKLHRVLDEAEIYQVVKEEFAKSDRYMVGILLLDGDGTSLKLTAISMVPSRLKVLERATGLQAKEYLLKLSKSSICRQVVREGKTVHANISDIIREFLPRPLAYLISKTMGYDKQSSILTPLHKRGKVIGVLGVSCTDLCEYLLHSVENLALHISTALELADEHVQRKRAVQALKRYHDHLGELVEERTAELKAVNEKLREEITERKEAAEALRESREKFQKMFESVTDGISVVDLSGVIIETNQRAVEVHGFASRGELLGRNALELIASRDHERIAANMRKAVREGAIRGAEYTLLKADGTEFPGELSTSVLRDASGKVVAHITIARDITERKRMEKALRESEERFRSIVENSHAGIMILDDAYRFVYANDELCQISGYSPDDLIGQDFRQFLDEESKELVAERYIRRQRGEEVPPRYEFNIVKKDGQKRRVEISSSIIKDSAGEVKTVAQILDITESKQAEEALADEATRRRILVDQSRDGIVVLDENGKVYEVNKRFAEMLGYTPREVSELYVWDWDARSSREQIQEMIRTVGAAGDHFETRHRRKDGTVIDVEISTNGAVIAGQKLIFCVCRDITERKKAEEALQNEKNKLQSLIDAMEDGLTIQDRDYNIIYQGKLQRTMFGEHLGEKCYRVYESREEVCEGCPVEKAFKDGKSYTSERKTVTPSGEVTFWENTANPVRDAGGRIVSCLEITRNITERKRAEEKEKQLQQELYLAQRLASVGELAAGVAHEINNPLTGVLGFSQRLMRKSTDEEVSRDLEVIYSEARRAAEVVQSLLTFARRRQPKKEYANINDIVQKTLELRAYALQTGNIEVVTALAPSLPQIMVDFPQMQEVFLNIILNAEQAMNEAHGRGKLVIKTRRLKDYLRISFADDGPGISPENIDKLFDPFFTTKEERGGTGLGLSACHGIVTEHGGRIYARSRPGKGATFFVELPLSPTEAAVAR